ncbi:MAG: S49 family peptidase [Chloroflexi bacterium]|nr:S49 family peptidase [Chloroflexota bacterium]
MTDSKSPPSELAEMTKNVRDATQNFFTEFIDLISTNTPSNFTNRTLGGLFLWIVIPIISGIWIAQTLVPRPAVGIIRLNTGISWSSADFIKQQIDLARSEPQIKAIVFSIDSPGGGVTSTQFLFMELLNLRETMPIVGSIDSMAASGGYYLAMATDPIFAKPSSIVGNIGVWGYVPPDLAVNDLVLASGPFKLTASNQAEFLREIESIKREFLATVRNSRGERLEELADEDILQGLAYPGREAGEIGMIDYLGSETDAAAEAARLAGIANYEIIDLETLLLQRLFGSVLPFFEAWVHSTSPLSEGFALPPGAYMLYDRQLGGAP